MKDKKVNKFSRNFVKKVVKKKQFDVLIGLDDCDLIKVDNWILEQIRKRDDTQFRYVGMLFGSQERVMRIWTNEKNNIIMVTLSTCYNNIVLLYNTTTRFVSKSR